jgi:hypothetical protein
MRERGAEAEARWRGLVSEQMGSGMSVAAFCRERGESVTPSFGVKGTGKTYPAPVRVIPDTWIVAVCPPVVNAGHTSLPTSSGAGSRHLCSVNP